LEMNIGPYSYEEYLSAVKSFHGYAAPGLMLGGFMVDLALSHMPEGMASGFLWALKNYGTGRSWRSGC
jgi:hypothetical protein